MRMALKFNVLFLSILLFLPLKTSSYHCDRTPDKPMRPKNTDDVDRYIIEISGDSTSYLPKETYTVTLTSNPILEVQHMFKDFMLSVEPDDSKSSNTKIGHLTLSDDLLSTFSRRCQNTILQTSSVPKSSIQVHWVAPPTGSGCIAFRATVVESKDNWYSEDGLLTKTLCEEVSENENEQPEVLDECTACDEAKYELVFEGLWTRNTHPKDYPSDIWYTKFGDIVGASHANGEAFWQYESLANDSLKALAEKGDTSEVETELKEKMGKTIRTIIKANGLRYPNITGRSFTFFRVDKKNHLVSIATKITPSPDWILGVSNFELCLSDGTWVEQRALNLYPWDIGTDDGVTYNSPNEPSSDPAPIQRIKSDNDELPFYDAEGKEMKPLAKLYLTRLKTYKMECEEVQETTTTSSDTTDEEDGQNEDCPTTPWSDWSSCSEKCGEGFTFRKREFINPDDEDICPTKIVDQKGCTGKRCKGSPSSPDQLPADDPKCELTEWSEWSSCSTKCGKGTMTRDKKFKNPEHVAQCENNDPSILQNNEECPGEEAECPEGSKEKDCSKTVWGPWSSCNVTCGTGIKTRLRMPDNDETDDELTDSDCSNMEQVTCYEPLCITEGTTGSNFGEITSLNQVTTDNILSQPYGPVANCKVSKWSVRGPCELSSGNCGKGYRTQHRQILQHAMNGGKSCPRKLMKKKRCNISCDQDKIEDSSPTTSTESGHHEVYQTETSETTTEESADCVMSSWSQWSPCSLSCGGSAVQQRTRSIKRPPKRGGAACLPRLDERPCPLPLACSDKGVPIM